MQLSFSSHLTSNQYKLIEFTEDVLNDVLTTGVMIKGVDQEPLVLCTPNKTYSLKQIENSNSLLLINDDLEQTANKGVEISALIHSGIEISPVSPKLLPLKKLLGNPINIHKEESISGGTPITDMEKLVQASRSEIITGLKKVGAFEYKGRWVLLSDENEDEILEDIVTLIRAEGWDWDNCNVDQIKSLLYNDYPQVSEIIDHICELYFNGSQFYKNQYIIFCATKILKDREQMPLTEFNSSWISKVKEDNWDLNLNLLQGKVITIIFGGKTYIKWLDAEDLPLQAQERFKLLFQNKAEWTYKEIAPYLQDLASSSGDLDQMLLKWALPVQRDGEKVYCIRNY